MRLSKKVDEKIEKVNNFSDSVLYSSKRNEWMKNRDRVRVSRNKALTKLGIKYTNKTILTP